MGTSVTSSPTESRLPESLVYPKYSGPEALLFNEQRREARAPWLICGALIALALARTSNTNAAQSAARLSKGEVRALGSYVQDDVLAAGSGTSADKTDRVKEAIQELSEASQPSERVHAAEFLGQLGNRRAAQPLIGALADPDGGVQRAAALALGELRDRRAVAALLGVLETGSDPGARGAAAFALGLIQDRRAVSPLIQALKDPDASIRISCAIALGRLGDPRAVEPLLALPHDTAHQTCLPIAVALGQIKGEAAIKPLLDKLNDSNPDVCQNTAIALVLLGNKREVEPLIKALPSRNPIIRRSAAYALGMLNDQRATVPLVARLKDKDVQVRLNVVEALGRLGDPKTIPTLERVAQSDSDASVRAGAVKALKKVRAAPRPSGKAD